MGGSLAGPAVTEGAAGGGAAIHPALLNAFRALDSRGVRWALLRGADDLLHPQGDVDVLVDAAALDRLDEGLAAAGLRRLGGRGHGSHRFYFSYDATEGAWLALDVVTEVAFGRYQQLRTHLAGPCLERRRSDGVLWRLAPEDEAWLYLLHLVLDKGCLAPERRGPARTAALQADVADPVARTLDACVRDDGARAVIEAARRQDEAGFATTASTLHRRWMVRHPARTAGRWAVNWVARHLGLPFAGQRPGLVVALVGPDGAGKSTLGRLVRSAFPGPSRTVHLGVWRQGRWDPVVHRIPGGRPAQRVLRVLGSSLTTRYHRRMGRLVLMDRSAHDVRLPGSVGSSLSARVVPWLLVRLAPDPRLVLLLDAPGELMFARKGEHTVEVLEKRRQAYLDMARADPAFVVLDATLPPEEVSRRAVSAIWTRLNT